MLFETIRVLDGVAERVALHRERAERSCGRALPQLETAVAMAVESLPRRGEFRLHVSYDAGGVASMTATPYGLRCLRRLRVVEAEVNYPFKDEDRSALDALRRRCSDADEVLILRGGWVTDTTFSNVLLGEPGHWVCPSHYLLRGTRRESLLRAGVVELRPLRAEDLKGFRFISLINAMLPPGRLMLPTTALML